MAKKLEPEQAARDDHQTLSYVPSSQSGYARRHPELVHASFPDPHADVDDN